MDFLGYLSSSSSSSEVSPSPAPTAPSDALAAAAQLRQQYRDALSRVDGMQVTAQPLMPYMTTGVKVTVPVMLRVKLGDFSAKIKRTPAHVCIVLDRSGSMSGSPLRAAKAAILNVIGQLEPSDLISLVTYDDRPTTVFAARSNEDASLEDAVNKIRTGGCTNISDGLAKGVACLAKTKSDGHDKVLFLFSDGQANSGITNLDKLGEVLTRYVKQEDVQISSFGVGSHYNEEWMRAIARAGRGNYFFIKDMQAMEDVVQRAVAGVTGVVAKDAVLRVRGVNGHTLLDLQTVSTPDVLMNGYKLNTLRSLGMYTVMANVELNPHPRLVAHQDPALADFEVVEPDAAPQRSRCDVLEYELAFSAVDPGLGLQNIRGHAHVEYTTAPEKLQERAPEVQCHVTMLECGELDQAVSKALGERKRDEAIRKKKMVAQKLEEVASLDTYGVIASALARAKNMIALLEKEGASEAAQKYQGYTAGWCQKAQKSRAKCEWEDEESDDDEDMGMGLFD
eukprot:TRINITY_DN17_c0_g1_i1.p2 TRINITY_DN17_c0_g1~~TRINITY_DN17_c0_g1_i1.p2  ORF type:complete len:528 (+),score=224.86 TRINITY_DN17_c0_g1_i1:61-1584(+)